MKAISPCLLLKIICTSENFSEFQNLCSHRKTEETQKNTNNKGFSLVNISLAKYYLIQNTKLSTTIICALYLTLNEVLAEINIRQKCIW